MLDLVRVRLCYQSTMYALLVLGWLGFEGADISIDIGRVWEDCEISFYYDQLNTTITNRDV